MKEYTGKEIIKAPDGVYEIKWNDGSFRKYGCKNGHIMSFFGTQYFIDLSDKNADCIEKIILIAEGN
jgi:hypothetical protein